MGGWRMIFGVASIIALGLVAGAACAQDEEGSTPGAIPDPGSYQGSTQLQQQSDQKDQQFRQQQQANQPTYEPPSYSSSPPAYSGGTASPRSSSSSRYYGTPRGPALAAAQGAQLRFRVGATAGGGFTPFPGAHLWVIADDPVRVLAAAGIPSIGSTLAQLTYDCQVAWVCVRDFKVITTRAVGVYTTDAQGHAQTRALQPGHYFVVGYGTVKGATVVWASPVRAQPGVTSVPIEQTDGSVVAVAPGNAP